MYLVDFLYPNNCLKRKCSTFAVLFPYLALVMHCDCSMCVCQTDIHGPKRRFTFLRRKEKEEKKEKEKEKSKLPMTRKSSRNSIEGDDRITRRVSMSVQRIYCL